MKRNILLFGFVAMLSLHAFAGEFGASVLARYTNWYRNDDDAVANCFVLDGPQSVIYFNGFLPNSMKFIPVSPAKIQALKVELGKLPPGIPADSSVRVLPTNRSEVYPLMIVNRMHKGGYPDYAKVDVHTKIGDILRSICKID